MQTELKEIQVEGVSFEINLNKVLSAELISKEIQNFYLIKNIFFNWNDIIVDVGLETGAFSIYYALKYPAVKVYSYEPIKGNYINFIANLEQNKIKNVTPHQLIPHANTLINIFNDIQLEEGEKLKILKLNCKGFEHKMLEDNLHLLKNVQYIIGELYHCPEIGFDAYKLHKEISNIIGTKNNGLTIIQTKGKI